MSVLIDRNSYFVDNEKFFLYGDIHRNDNETQISIDFLAEKNKNFEMKVIYKASFCWIPVTDNKEKEEELIEDFAHRFYKFIVEWHRENKSKNLIIEYE